MGGEPSSRGEKLSFPKLLKNDSERDSPLGGGPTGGKRQAGVGLISLVGDRDNVYLQVIKKRVKRIRQRLTSRKTEFNEPPSGIEGHGLGTATVAGWFT